MRIPPLVWFYCRKWQWARTIFPEATSRDVIQVPGMTSVGPTVCGASQPCHCQGGALGVISGCCCNTAPEYPASAIAQGEMLLSLKESISTLSRLWDCWYGKNAPSLWIFCFLLFPVLFWTPARQTSPQASENYISLRLTQENVHVKLVPCSVPSLFPTVSSRECAKSGCVLLPQRIPHSGTSHLSWQFQPLLLTATLCSPREYMQLGAEDMMIEAFLEENTGFWAGSRFSSLWNGNRNCVLAANVSWVASLVEYPIQAALPHQPFLAMSLGQCQFSFFSVSRPARSVVIKEK